MTESASQDPESRATADSESSVQRPEPSFWQTMKWALVMLGITGLIAAITIPILQWFE